MWRKISEAHVACHPVPLIVSMTEVRFEDIWIAGKRPCEHSTCSIKQTACREVKQFTRPIVC